MFSVRELDKAEELRKLGDDMEREERRRIYKTTLYSKVNKEEVKVLQ